MSDPSADRPLRVAGPYFYRLAPDSDIGGEVYERMLLERLPSLAIALTLGLPRPLQVPDPPSEWTVEELPAVPAGHWLAAPLRFAPYVARLLRAGRADLLRGHSVRYCAPSLLLGRALAGRGGGTHATPPVPIVLHHHHLTERWGALEARLLARADAVVAVSVHARDELLGAGVPERLIRVIVQGVARPPATGGWPAAWPDAGLRLLSLGRLEPRKRPQLAIDALAALHRRGVAASLVIAGAGPLSPELATRARALGVGDRVALLGRVADADKWRLYDSADALLFGSGLEGFGVVIAEAQSRGVPVVAATGTATVEAFDPGRSGLLAAPDGEAFATALARLADEPARRAMSAAAREFAARFDWDRCAAEVAALYRELVLASGPHRRFVA